MGMPYSPSPQNKAPQIRVVRSVRKYPTLPQSPRNLQVKYLGWGRPEAGLVRVWLAQTVYAKIMQHAQTGVTRHARLEVGGFLLGKAYASQPGGQYDVTIEEALPDELGISNPASFQFTPKSWSTLLERAEEQYSNLRVVGFYHTHPGYGVFYSGTDENTHYLYFSEPWCVGLVVDPIHNEGLFLSLPPGQAKPTRLPGFYERLGPDEIGRLNWRNWGQPTLPLHTRQSIDDLPNAREPVAGRADAVSEGPKIRVHPRPQKNEGTDPAPVKGKFDQRFGRDWAAIGLAVAIGLALVFGVLIGRILQLNHAIADIQNEVDRLNASVQVLMEQLPTLEPTTKPAPSGAPLNSPGLHPSRGTPEDAISPTVTVAAPSNRTGVHP